MKISKWCSSSTSSRWWYQSASLSRDRCLSTIASSLLHNRIAQGEYEWRPVLFRKRKSTHVKLLTSAPLGYFRDLEKYDRKVCKNHMINVSVLFFVVLQPISRLLAAPQLWAVSDHTVAIPLQPSTVAAAIYRFELLSCRLYSEIRYHIVMLARMALYAGVPPPGPGVMVMQLSVPNGPQPSQNPPLVQWNPCKYYSIEQRPGKPGDLYKPDNTPQVCKNLHQYTYSFKR